MVLRQLIFIIFFYLLIFPVLLNGDPWEDWHKDSSLLKLPQIKESEQKEICLIELITGEPEVSYFVPGTGSFLIYSMVRFYQNNLRSRQVHCPCYPSCSRYSLKSLKEYGGLIGTLMTIDRLLFRERYYFIHKHHYRIKLDEKNKYWDLPENNYIFSSKIDLVPSVPKIKTKRFKLNEKKQ